MPKFLNTKGTGISVRPSTFHLHLEGSHKIFDQIEPPLRMMMMMMISIATGQKTASF
jgi:hypothetical protein